jgi:hypothetical protein
MVNLGLIETQASNQQDAKKLFEQVIQQRPKPLGPTELARASTADTNENENTPV